jgi:exopolysaccharide biosynthesis polyprenyl glycosylphosphotransferase
VEFCGGDHAAVVVSVGPDLRVHSADLAYAEPSGPSLAAVPRPSGLTDAPRRRRGWLARVMLVHADLFALLLAFFAAERLFGGSSAFQGGLTEAGGLFLASLPLWVLAIKSAGLYSRDDDVIQHTTLDEAPKLIWMATVGTWAFLVLAWALSIQTPELSQLVGFWVLAAALLPAVRVLARSEFQRDADFPQNTVIVGAGAVGQLLAYKILGHPEYNLRVLGFIDAAPKERRSDLGDLHMLGQPEDLPRLVDELSVERVIVAFSNDSHEEILDLIRLLREDSVRIDIVPRLFDVLPPSMPSNTVEGIPLLTLPRLRLSAGSRFVKRTFDLVLGTLALFLLFPLIAFIAAMIKLDSRGPVFFRQVRVGTGSRPFRMWKFRTMVSDADARKHEVAHLNKHALPGGDPRMFKVKSDPRVTRVGRMLRRYSLDELPQLINVVTGEMSLIGPRPLIVEEDEHISRWGRTRLLLKPGITGLWQVLGRSAIPFEEMVKLDYLYVTNWSLSGDFRLLLQTVPAALRGERDGAY